MSSPSRTNILHRIRTTLSALPERAAYPNYDAAIAVTFPQGETDAWTWFAQRLKAVNGLALESVEALASHLREGGYLHGYCDPELRQSVGEKLGVGFTVEYVFERSRVDDYQFGITRAVGAIAETGTIVINDASTSSRLAALAPWVHVTVLRPGDLWPDIPTALTQLGKDPNTIWITGPSKTADVEGILIEGVHGPGEQICLRLPLA